MSDVGIQMELVEIKRLLVQILSVMKQGVTGEVVPPVEEKVKRTPGRPRMKQC